MSSISTWPSLRYTASRFFRPMPGLVRASTFTRMNPSSVVGLGIVNRSVVRFGFVDEMRAVGRQRNRMRERGIGEAQVVRPVEPHAMELKLHVVVAVAPHVVQGVRRLVDSGNAGDFGRHTRDLVQQSAG